MFEQTNESEVLHARFYPKFPDINIPSTTWGTRFRFEPLAEYTADETQIITNGEVNKVSRTIRTSFQLPFAKNTYVLLDDGLYNIVLVSAKNSKHDQSLRYAKARKDHTLTLVMVDNPLKLVL